MDDARDDGTLVLTNARVVREHETIEGGVTIRDGHLVSIDSGPASAGGAHRRVDLGGDWLIPGLVELHTDHLEVHLSPRPGVRWPEAAAIRVHDAQIASAGITTVFDCLRIGRDEGDASEADDILALAAALRRADETWGLRAAHRLHVRCEVSAPDALVEFKRLLTAETVHLVSLMDHAQGRRQFASLEAASVYYRATRGCTEAEFDRFVATRAARSRRWAGPQRRAIAAACRERGIPVASHDDASAAHVDESDALGVRIAEFPTTMEAACRAHDHSMAVLMGAPNVVRGLSHSGNVGARELAAAGRLDVLSSDYVPFSLVQAVFLLALDLELCSVPEAVALASANPARAAGLDDVGRISVGRAADLVQVSASPGTVPVVRRVWRAGERVA